MAEKIKVIFERGEGCQESADGVISVDKTDYQIYLGDGTQAHRLGEATTEQLEEKLDGSYVRTDSAISESDINDICQ